MWHILPRFVIYSPLFDCPGVRLADHQPSNYSTLLSPGGMIQSGLKRHYVGHMAKRKLNIGGNEFMAEEIDFESPDGERWTKYVLHDGTEMKVKAVVAEILRVEGHYAPNGDPMYTVNASIIVSTNSPEQLKKKVS
jgi:hypothetical protein